MMTRRDLGWWDRDERTRRALPRRGRLSVPAVALAAVTLCVAALGFAPVAEANQCPNEPRRVEQGATYLTRCRAFEMVSAPGAAPGFGGVTAGLVALDLTERAAQSGERMSMQSWYPPNNAEHANGIELARRGPEGWSDESVIPPRTTSARTGCQASMFFSDQLSAGVLTDDETQTIDPYCGHNTPPLVSPEPEGWLTEPPYRNLFLRKDLSVAPAYSMVNRTPATAIPADAQLQDASSDFSRVIFSESAALTANAPAGEALYGWEANDVTLVSVLPTGTAVAGQIVDPADNAQTGAAPYMHGASANGETIFFTYGDDLYARTNAFKPASAFTLQLDESANGGPGGGGRFLAANTAGTRAFFMDGPPANLTSDTQAGSGQNLYEYNLVSHELTDLTAVEHANVLGVAGWGENAAREGHLYFVAEGALASGATEAEPSLYVTGGGQPQYVAPLSAATDHTDWTPPDQLTARVSPDGELLAFDSAAKVKTAGYPEGYDNLDTATGKPDEEIYLFDARTKSTLCVSCRPGRARPESGGAELPRPESSGGFGGGPGYLQRNVFDDGSVFFQTAEALVPQDVNRHLDVYEFSEGAARLISAGTSEAASMFADASESGNDVFFATTQPLVKRDTDNALSLYDARVGGGFAEPASAVACRSADGCRGGEGGAATWTAPASVTFSGAGNLPPISGSPPPHGRVPTQKHKLARALKACSRKRSKAERRRCRRKAHARYATAHGRRDHGKTGERRQRSGRRSGK